MIKYVNSALSESSILREWRKIRESISRLCSVISSPKLPPKASSISDDSELLSVELNGVKLKVSSKTLPKAGISAPFNIAAREFHVRDITNVDLRHLNGNETVDVYIGVINQNPTSVFSVRVIKRVLLGRVENERALAPMRAVFGKVGAPIIEL